MGNETEASESGIGTDRDSVQFKEMIRALIGQVNDRFRSRRVFIDMVNVGSGTVAHPAVGTTVADSDGSSTNGSGYANLSDLGSANLASGSDLAIEARYANYPRVLSTDDQVSFPQAFRQMLNMIDVQQRITLFIKNRSNRDSETNLNEDNDESPVEVISSQYQETIPHYSRKLT
jgi:hypothetical protein